MASVLPPRATYLAGPITNGAKGYVQQAVTKVIASPQFKTLWTEANRFAHAQLVAVLEGNSKAVKATNGTVVLDLVPTLNAALGQIQDVVSGIVGRPVTLPTLSGDEIPSTACAKISDALGVALPSNCAQIPLFPADKLTRAQDLVRRLHNGVTLLFVLTPAVGLVALWASDRRRRTLLQLLGGGVIGLVVVRRAVIWLQHTLVNTGKPVNKAARQAILDQVLHNFFIMSAWIMLGLVVVAAVAAVTGRYAWARSLRGHGSSLARQTWIGARVAVKSFGASAAPGWIGEQAVLLQIIGGALAVILLLALPISFVGTLIVAGIAAAYEVELEHIKRVRHLGDTPVELRDGSRGD